MFHYFHLFDLGVAWRPRSREERTIECGFSSIKSHCHGNPTLKDGIYGTYLYHFKNVRASEAWSKMAAAGKDEKAVSQEELTKIATQSLHNAALFQARF